MIFGRGGKKMFKWYLKSKQTDTQTHRHTHIWTNRLIESLDKLVQDQFLQIVKDHQGDKFGYVGKIMICFFLQV